MNDDPRPESTPGAPSEAETELRRLFLLSLDLMCVAGFDGFFKRVNPAFKRVLGYDDQELLTRQFIEFVHPEDQEKTLAEVENLAAGDVTIDFENRYRTKDGVYRWLAWRAAPMVDSELIYAIARDITEQKKAQELLARQSRELERSNADLEQFAHVASHDLRAPLRSIVTLAGFIERDLTEGADDKATEHLAELKRRALLMRALTDDLLVYSQAGYEENDLEEVDVGALVGEIGFLLDPPEAFRIVADSSLPVFETARGPLEQVLRNLIGNAIKHHDRDSGEIRVSARDADDSFEFVVEDDGPGIPDDDRKRVFQVFEQLEPAQSGPGLGMGLSLVQRIVERFAGRVKIDAGEERGATFRFTWPKHVEKGML